MDPVLIGDVLGLIDGRWRVVLVAASIPVTDRRRWEKTDPTFGPGSRPYRRPTGPPPNPHTKTWRPESGWN